MSPTALPEVMDRVANIKSQLNGLVNGTQAEHRDGHSSSSRVHPQTSYSSTAVDPGSFYGKLRKLYSGRVLKTQLEQMRKQGSYDAFKGEWHPAYDVRRLHGAKMRVDAIPPSLFWESDVGKWIEAACYFLGSAESADNEHAAEFERCIQELVDMIEKFQRPDGYLDIYFSVVDKEGRFRNFRDMHEMYNSGHLLEGALAHYQYTGSRQFLDVMIRNIDCYIQNIGPKEGQLHAYPGHPEIELAVLRLYKVTQDQRHLDFAHYLLSERGQKRDDQEGLSYFSYEARQRKDEIYPHTMSGLDEFSYAQAHATLHDQQDILGHSVRALYLTTAAADYGGQFLEDAKRLWADCVDKKMYATGGIGTEPIWEGFSAIPYRLPQGTAEGGCYAETCASIACMMTSERILSYGYDGKVRDVLELCLLNGALGGASLNGQQFSYANKHATTGDETAIRNDWFEVCCCPPNLSRTLGMLGGYTWSADIDESARTINLDVYLFVAATRTINLPDGQATVTMRTEMPWVGQVDIQTTAPQGWKWNIQLPQPDYAENVRSSVATTEKSTGSTVATLDATSSLQMTFDMPVRLLASHPLSFTDTLTVQRGPIVYTAESIDNDAVESTYPHFAGVGITESIVFTESKLDIEGIPVVMLQARDGVFGKEQVNAVSAYRPVAKGASAVTWKKLEQGLVLVPWFARANRGGQGHVRTSFDRCVQ